MVQTRPIVKIDTIATTASHAITETIPNKAIKNGRAKEAATNATLIQERTKKNKPHFFKAKPSFGSSFLLRRPFLGASWLGTRTSSFICSSISLLYR